MVSSFAGQNDVDKRLHKGDAAFVDIYHTNRGTLGDSDHQTGDINVYVNGGASQPGCEEADESGFKGWKMKTRHFITMQYTKKLI